MSGPNRFPTSARPSLAPASYPSRYANQSGPPNSWNTQNARHSAYPPNTTYQYRSQPHWQNPNAPGQQSQAQDQNRTQGPPFGSTGSQSAPAPYHQGSRNSFQPNTRVPPGNFRPSGQRAYTAAPDESAHLSEPVSNEPESGLEPNASDSTGYWIETPIADDSYSPNPDAFNEADAYNGSHNEMDLPDATAYFTKVEAIPQNAQSSPKSAQPRQQKAPIVGYSSRVRNYQRISPPLLYDCRKCQESFPSRTKLFNHLDLCLYSDTNKDPPAAAHSATPIEPTREKPSNAPPLSIGTGMGYRGFTYAMAPIRLSKTAKAKPCCFDTSCLASLIDRQFLKTQDPSAEIRLMATPLKINGIAGNQHTSAEYVIATLRIPGKDMDGPAEAVITRELHIVDHLDANILIGTDVMLPERMDILLSDKTLRIGTCNVDVPVQLRVRAGYQQHLFPVHAKATTSIPPRSAAIVPIHSLSTTAG